MKKRFLVAGALGVVGRAMLRELELLPGAEVVGVARRPKPPDVRTEIVSMDLSDSGSCKAGLDKIGEVSHLIYCASYEKSRLVSGWTAPDHVEINAGMLRNLMEALTAHSPNLEHVTLLQGTKAYGAAAGFFKLPAKESDARYPAPNFYYAQEDFLRDAQRHTDWTWTILRPQFVCGFAVDSPMNGLSAIAAYAAICRELDMPLRFPGGPLRVQEATDSRILAKAAVWAGQTPACANEIFNIVNGDCFTWEPLWPRIARVFNMECGPPAPCKLSKVMVDKGPVWERIVRRFNLIPYTLEQLVPSWEMADNLMGLGIEPRPMLLSGIKAREFGFNECIDTEEMFVDWLKRLQADRVMPT